MLLRRGYRVRTDRGLISAVLLLAQGGLVYQLTHDERMPAAPDLAQFPTGIETWRMVQDEKMTAEVALQLGADRTMSRIYSDSVASPSGQSRSAGAFVAWFQSQRGGAKQPHSPKVCLPGAGWTPEDSGELTLDTKRGPITVNRMIIDNQGQRAAILYWYQTPQRVVSNEWSAKFWLVADALRDKRTDTSLVRVLVWVGSDGPEVAVKTATEFAKLLYPALKSSLPQ